MAKNKNVPDPLEFTEAEKKALEKLDHSHLLREKQILQDRIEELQVKVYDLNEEIRTINQQNLHLSLKMEQDIILKNDELIYLNKQFENYRKSQEEQLDKLREAKDLKIKQILEEKNALYNETDARIKELELKNKSLMTFEEREIAYKQTIDDLQMRMKEKEYAHHDEILKNQKNFQKQTQNLTNVNNVRIQDIQLNADKIAEQKVKDQQESIKRENQKIKSEMEVYLRELEQLKKERTVLLQENHNNTQNMSINQQEAKEYQTLNHNQVVKIKKLKEKVEYLKNYISNEVTKYTKEIEMMKHQSNQKQQEYEIQIRNLKELLHTKSKELKNIKALAQMILDQRSDIEQFFLQAIDQVKNEMRKRQSKSNVKLPDITQKSHSVDKVDINDLDLEEKEKLLRILFSKMNSGQAAGNWKANMDGSSFRDNHFQ